MRERVRELGGSLTIHSSHQGTLLTIVLPLPANSESGATEPSVDQNQVPAA